jgi:hypothetical protein
MSQMIVIWSYLMSRPRGKGGLAFGLGLVGEKGLPSLQRYRRHTGLPGNWLESGM